MRIAIVEDEKENSDLIEKYIREFGKTADATFIVDKFSDGLEFLAAYKPVYDLIFMDIKMPNIDGMETAKRLREIDGEVGIIFITNLLNYAIKGYQVDAFDFVLKPVGYADFASRMKKFLKKRSAFISKDLVLTANNAKIRVSVDSICYLEVDGHNIIYHLTDGEYTVRTSLIKARQELPEYFAPCNNGILVNLHFVQTLERDRVLVYGRWLPVSRPKRKGFKEIVMKYLSSDKK